MKYAAILCGDMFRAYGLPYSLVSVDLVKVCHIQK